MILERTGDGRWWVKHTDLSGSADEWLGDLMERFGGVFVVYDEGFVSCSSVA